VELDPVGSTPHGLASVPVLGSDVANSTIVPAVPLGTEARKAMDSEYMALIKNETWHLVAPEPGQNIIYCMWVHKIKRTMVLLIYTKLVLLQRVSNNDMGLTRWYFQSRC